MRGSCSPLPLCPRRWGLQRSPLALTISVYRPRRLLLEGREERPSPLLPDRLTLPGLYEPRGVVTYLRDLLVFAEMARCVCGEGTHVRSVGQAQGGGAARLLCACASCRRRRLWEGASGGLVAGRSGAQKLESCGGASGGHSAGKLSVRDERGVHASSRRAREAPSPWWVFN